MTAIQQAFLGTSLLALSAIVHVSVIAYSIPHFPRLSRILPVEKSPQPRMIGFVLLTVLVLVLAHTIQVWGWAVVFLWITDLSGLPTSFYFATVTYTTLGYGDIVLGPDARIVATLCAVTGLLTFGISTAFLIGVLSRVLPDGFGEK